MGGDITVRSEPGEGSAFTAALPLASVAAPSVASHPAEAPLGAPTRRLRVLVAEDHPVNRAYLEAVLDKLGHAAEFATDGDGAVRAVERRPPDEPFDVVLMDLHMPGMDGFAAARSIRAMAAPRGLVPIVALTADAFQASRHLAHEAGMEGFLTKPAHLPQLREALARFGGHSTANATASSSGEEVEDAAALLDPATVDEVRGALSPDRYGVLLGGFLTGRRLAISELRVASNARLHNEVRARAHALKGAALSLGLRAVGECAGRLQNAAESAPAEADALIETLATLFDASLAACAARGLIPAPAAEPVQAALSPPLTPPAAPAPA
jgi:CheY-like chemotaxis protein